jgi:hypothetical protein
MEAIIIPPKNKEQSNLFEQLAKTLKFLLKKQRKRLVLIMMILSQK